VFRRGVYPVDSGASLGLLSVAIALGSVGGIGSLHTDTVAAATSKESTSVYKFFQLYVQKPASLAQVTQLFDIISMKWIPGQQQ
jgi:hypothetical protein